MLVISHTQTHTQLRVVINMVVTSHTLARTHAQLRHEIVELRVEMASHRIG